jgi:endonuclease YncB( thermonuclease family)
MGVLYQNRSLFYPVVDLVDALRVDEGLEQKKSGELSGKVTRVLSGDTFVVKDERDRAYTIRLTGIVAPRYSAANRAERLRAGESRTNLSRLILSNEVRIELTYTNQSRGALGIAYLANTNINLLAVETGFARANRDYLNGLPLKNRYQLIQADRRARERVKSE